LTQEQSRYILTFFIICPNFDENCISQSRSFLFKKVFFNNNLDRYFEYLTKLLINFKKFEFETGDLNSIIDQPQSITLNYGNNRILSAEYTG
jgi:UDP-galactopyranose mutase